MHTSSTTTFKQKILLSCLGLFITLVLCELILRLGGWTLSYLQDLRNDKYRGQKNLYTIMCIGESSTALGGDNSYPSILERLLNQSGGNQTYRVINAGKPSVQSEYIVDNLEGQINKYHPKMVLAMVGINDDIYGHIDYYDAVKKLKWYQCYKFLKIYDLYSYFKNSLVNYRNKMSIQHALVSTKPATELAEKQTINPNALDDISRFKYAYALIERAFILRNQTKYQEAFALYKEAIYIYPKDVRPYMEYINALNEIHDQESTKRVYELAIANNPRSDWGYAGLANYYRRKNKLALADAYQKKSIECRKDSINGVLVVNYRRIKEILDARHITLICVQYPMREIDTLKKIFKDPHAMVFVDNENIFKDAVKKFGYYAVFGDTAGGDFGHCTARGNALLAENIKTVVLNNIK